MRYSSKKNHITVIPGMTRNLLLFIKGGDSSLEAGMTVTMCIVIIALLLLPNEIRAQDTGSGLDFLNIGPSARLLSISEASSAIKIGASAIYSNPSLLALEEQSSLDANYTLWISNVSNEFAALNIVKNGAAYAVGVYSSGSDGFEARDQPGPSAGEFSIRYLSLSGAVARQLGPLSIGVSGQYLREEVFQFRANGFAFSFGATAHFFDDKMLVASTVKNLGSMESLDNESTPLPSTFNAGISARLINFTTPGPSNLPVLIYLMADWSKPIKENPTSDFIKNNADESYFALAISANLDDLIFIDGGYRWGPTERPFSFGLGLAIESVRVNYALVPFSTGFGTVHSFGLQYYF